MDYGLGSDPSARWAYRMDTAMTQLERQIRTAQHRLWFHRWLNDICLCGAIAGVAFAVAVLIQRLYELPISVFWAATGFVAAAAVGSAIRTMVRREDAALAAARLDEAAGLRERISSGRYCVGLDDPFAQAVVADAERISASISVRSHIRLTLPRRFGVAVGALVLAGIVFLVPTGLLKSTEAKASTKQSVEREQTHLAVKRQLDPLRQMAESTPALAEFKDDLDGLEKLSGGKLERPADIRHEAVKKIDKLEDAVKQKLASEKYEAVPEMRKLLRGLKSPDSAEAPTQKLNQALSKGDFKAAKEEVQALREQLATLKSEEDKETVAKLSKQLENIAKQLEQLAKDEQLAQKLEQAGIKKEDVERMLEKLSKADLDQLKKQLEEKGLSQQQIEKLAKQLQQRQQAGATAKKLAKAMKQGASAAQAGQQGEAIAGLTQAEQQLSELEQLELEMNQLDAAASALQDAKDNLDKPCPG